MTSPTDKPERTEAAEVVLHLRTNAEGVREMRFHAGWKLLDDAADLIESQARRLAEVERAKRAFVLCRADRYEHGIESDRPIAVYVGDSEGCKADLEHRQMINPNSHYYVLDVKLNPKSVWSTPEEEA